MEIAVAAGIGGAVLVVGFGLACFKWGSWKAKQYVSQIAERRQRAATEVSSGVDPRGAELLDEL